MERGDFEILMPPGELRPFVRRYLYANRTLATGLTLRAKPTGYTYISNFFGAIDGDYGVIDGRRFERTSRWFFFGQITDHEVLFHHTRSLQLIATEFTASGHYRLLGMSGADALGSAAILAEAAPEAAALAEKSFGLGIEADRDRHVEEMNAYVARLADRARPPVAMVDDSVAVFEKHNGAVRVADVCRQIGVGTRELNRAFTSIVGLSPKVFARILQMNWVVNLLYANETAKLTEIAQEAGFYDQAHFNRAMQRFFKEGPREFLRSDHPAFRSFLAGSRRYGPSVPDDQ